MKLVWICSSNIGPYYYYMFKSLHELVKGFLVICVNDKKSQPRPWPERLIKSINWKMLFIEEKDNILRILNIYNPKLIFVAGNSRPYIFSAIWAKIKKIPCVLVSDTPCSKSKSKLKDILKANIIKFLFSGLFVPGKMAKNYRISQGIPPEKIWTGSYVTDIEHFKNSNSNWGPQKRLPKNFFLYVGRLSKEKNLGLLLKAFFEYKRKGGEWALVIVGKGPQEEELKSLIPVDFQKDVYFPGWIKNDELPALYKTASCFVLPSIWEPWGVVVNEAMAAGLPILLSKNCGCAPDLCYQGINGFLFDPFDTEELVELMLYISSLDEDTLKKMGESSKKIIADYTPKKWTETVLKICESLSKI